MASQRCRIFTILGLGLLLAPSAGLCQAVITANENYDAHVRHRSLINSLDERVSFGDRTDLSSGATTFYVTVVNVPGNNNLELALRYKYVRDRHWYANPTSSTWERDDPYITGDFGKAAGWVLGSDHAPGSPRTTDRCTRSNGHSTPPILTSDNGRHAEYHPSEYWSGYRVVLPRGQTALLNPLGGVAPPALPSTGGPYKWATNDGWVFSCIPLKNGVGEGFLAHAPNGDRYYFDDYRLGPELPAIDKYNFGGQDVTLERQEIRIYASRIEDRFGNYVDGLTGSDQRSITLTTSGSELQATAGGRTWTIATGNPFTITNPDGSQWKHQSNWMMTRTYPAYEGPGIHCGAVNPPPSATGTGAITVTLPSGATGVFEFSPIVRGYSHVALKCETPDGANTPYVVDPSRVTEIALTRRTISGGGIPSSWSQVTYGPPNDCYGASGYRVTCTADSPTTTTTMVARSDGTSTIYTFGNRYRVNQGLLLRQEDLQSPGNPLSVVTQEWQLFPPIGASIGQYSQAGALGSNFRVALSKRAVEQQGQSFTWQVMSTCGTGSNSLCFDEHARPTRISRSSQAAQ